MKIRNGFVSNSSSSSFVYMFDKKAVDEAMNPLIKYFTSGSAIDFMEGQVVSDTVRNMDDWHDWQEDIQQFFLFEEEETKTIPAPSWSNEKTQEVAVYRFKTIEEVMETLNITDPELIREIYDEAFASYDEEGPEMFGYEYAQILEGYLFDFKKEFGGIIESSDF